MTVMMFYVLLPALPPHKRKVALFLRLLAHKISGSYISVAPTSQYY